jgi:hypothetical protein
LKDINRIEDKRKDGSSMEMMVDEDGNKVNILEEIL